MKDASEIAREMAQDQRSEDAALWVGVAAYYIRAAQAEAYAEGRRAGDEGIGWLFHNPDTGVEFSESHPLKSGEVPNATDVRRATAAALLAELLLTWDAARALASEKEGA